MRNFIKSKLQIAVASKVHGINSNLKQTKLHFFKIRGFNPSPARINIIVKAKFLKT